MSVPEPAFLSDDFIQHRNGGCEGRSARNVLRPGKPPKRNCRYNPFDYFWRYLCRHSRIAKSWRDAGHADLVAREFLRPGPRHGGNASFRGGAVGPTDIARAGYWKC